MTSCVIQTLKTKETVDQHIHQPLLLQDIIINADLFASRPKMMSGGLGFTDIIGALPPRLRMRLPHYRSLSAAGAAVGQAAACKHAAPCPVPPLLRPLHCIALPTAASSGYHPRHVPACSTHPQTAAPHLPPAGVDTTSETAVRAAGGAWNTGLTCSNGATPPQRVITSANSPQMWTAG